MSRFPEILYVRYYDSDGRILYVEQAANDATAYPALEREEFLLLSEDSEAYNIDTSYEPLVRISQAVVIEVPSMASLRISLSSVRSDTAERSRLFSRSRSFRRRAWETFMPPYSRRQR